MTSTSYALLWTALLSIPLEAQRIEVTPDTVLVDQTFQVLLTGVKPREAIALHVDGANGAWYLDTSFVADDAGRVRVSDPGRLIWSARGKAPAGGLPAGATPWIFSARAADGSLTSADTLWRRAVAAGVRIVPVRENGLVGTAYFPPGGAPHSAIIVLGGSSGGIPGPAAHAGGLGSRGYVVLALAYFNADGLPPMLNDIPLEYFGTAIAWLKSQPAVDSTRIGVMGTSRGGELALLLGATFPSLRLVVANVPSNVIWPGLSDDTGAPAWTSGGKPIRGVPTRFTAADSVYSSRDRFLRRMTDARVLARAEIPVERINGPVLLFSAKDDQVWPSDIFAARVVDRLKARRFKHPVEHYSYENAGHLMTRPYSVTTGIRDLTVHPVSHRKTMFGGTPAGQAAANEDSWRRLLDFLDRYLGH